MNRLAMSNALAHFDGGHWPTVRFSARIARILRTLPRALQAVAPAATSPPNPRPRSPKAGTRVPAFAIPPRRLCQPALTGSGSAPTASRQRRDSIRSAEGCTVVQSKRDVTIISG